MAKPRASVDFGPVFFEKNTGDPAPFNRWFGCGKLLGGWSLDLGDLVYRGVASQLLRQWPFASKYRERVLIPFPSSRKEWDVLQDTLRAHGLTIPDTQKEWGTKALGNALFRQQLSHVATLDAQQLEEVRIPNLKTPQGFEQPLFDFQYVALKYIQAMGFRAIVGDDMGLGKTPVGLASALLYGADKVIIVTRAVALGAWKRAIHTWTDYPVWTAQGTRVKKSRRKDGLVAFKEGEWTLNEPLQFDRGILLLNYDILTAWKEPLLALGADMLVLDEFHALKEPKATRSQVGYTLMQQIPAVVALTGTPLNNRPLELYHLLHHLHPGQWGEFFPYARRYCEAKKKLIRQDFKGGQTIVVDGKKVRVPVEHYAWDFSGSRNEKELYRRLRSKAMVRRLKDEVLDLLPPIEETIAIEPSPRYWEVESGVLDSISHLVSTNASQQKEGEASLHHLFAAAAMDKLDWMREWLQAFLEDCPHKIVIFFQYQRVGEALSNMLKEWNVGHVNLWGTKPDKDGDHLFQTQDDKRVALCSYSMAREAVTLTASKYQLAMEYPWVPGWAEQARDRTRRIGQENAVTYYYPILVGSVEERIVLAMLKKQDIVSIITQGKHLRSIGIDTNVLRTSGSIDKFSAAKAAQTLQP